MKYKIITGLFFSLYVFVFQTAFIGNLPSYFSLLNLSLIALLFVLSLRGFKEAFWWAVFLGLLTDLYGFHIFGLAVFSYLATLFILNTLLSNYFTNRSLYSFFLLIFLAILFFDLFFHLSIYLSGFFSSGRSLAFLSFDFIRIFFIKIMVNFIFVFFAYYILSYISKKLKPVFLISRKKYENN